MIVMRSALAVALVVAFAATPVVAQDTIKIGELNSYKTQSAFLDPYKKGMELLPSPISPARRKSSSSPPSR
jgi:branched-chain amino acid transport system substrate-binding protein